MTQVSEARQLVRVRGRFHRSVQLNRDYEGRADLSGYLVTPTVSELIGRIVGELLRPGGVRAWSITGPYGTGKSSFALFLSRLLARQLKGHPQADAFAAKLPAEPLLPILLVGQRASLKDALAQALKEALEPLGLDLSSPTPGALSDEELVARFEKAAAHLPDYGYGGLVVILDEFGKFLEHSSQHGEDLLIMQSVAEAATRSDVPFVLLSILHTGFAEYVDAFDTVRRAEWQKVQGRFTDVAFQEPPEQLLKLLGEALEADFPGSLAQAYARKIADCIEDDAFAEARSRLPLTNLLPACAPLHPLCALLLWPLFRSKLAQNERSLFSFLTSHEPFGLQDFLQTFSPIEESDTPSFYRLPMLYDYVQSSLGAGLYRGEGGRRWAELEDALDRVSGDAPVQAKPVLKALGLLWLYGAPVGLRANEATLILAVGDSMGVQEALAYLEHASIIVFRRFEGAYGLWEGSDVDLDAQFEIARQLLTRGNLAARLKRVIELRPVVARAHYIQTGTLRYFTVEVVSGSETTLGELIHTEFQGGDGRIIYVLSDSPNVGSRTHAQRQERIVEAEALTSELGESALPVILAFPHLLAGIEETLADVECWRYVAENTPALLGDRVAKRELEVRLAYAEERLEAVAGSVFGLRGHRFDPTATTWVQGGRSHALRDARAFTSWLSDLSSEVYYAAAPLHNELLNRTNLSSAAKAALNRLIKAMVAAPQAHRFDIPGTPAEVSMYESLFGEGGFHRYSEDETWQLSPPEPAWQRVWDAIQAFLVITKQGRRPLRELYTTLKLPPYGLREGPLPLLVCAVLLVKRGDVVLYYNGLFQPELYEETLELLIRVPESFELQQLDLTGESRVVLDAITQALDSLALYGDADEEGSPLLRLVKPLILTVARLPTYSKNTIRLDPPEAADLRNVVLRAKDPHALLFDDIPRILGVDANHDSQAFAEKLRRCVWALQRAYPSLLDILETHLKHTFDLKGNSAVALRDNLKFRAAPLKGYSSDPVLTLFINEAARDDTPDWREGLGRAVLKGKPPTTWSDADVVAFGLNLTRLASDFMRLEELVAEKQASGAERIIRVGILGQQVNEVRQTISLHPEQMEDVTKLTQTIMLTLRRHDAKDNGDRVRLAALAQAVAYYLGGERPDNDDT